MFYCSFFEKPFLKCRQFSDSEGLHPPFRAHSIKEVSASVNFMRNWSVTSVLEVVCWKSDSVFASFYLKGIQHNFDLTVL